MVTSTLCSLPRCCCCLLLDCCCCLLLDFGRPRAAAVYYDFGRPRAPRSTCRRTPRCRLHIRFGRIPKPLLVVMGSNVYKLSGFEHRSLATHDGSQTLNCSPLDQGWYFSFLCVRFLVFFPKTDHKQQLLVRELQWDWT